MLTQIEFLQGIRDMPLTCIDLLLIDPDNRLVLGRRRNKPAQGWLFAAGGRIRKNEIQAEAMKRLTVAELGVEIPFDRWKLMGIYDHIYDDNMFNGKHLDGRKIGTHCIALAYVLRLSASLDSELLQTINTGMNQQHHDVQWIDLHDILTNDAVHDYTKTYARDAMVALSKTFTV